MMFHYQCLHVLFLSCFHCLNYDYYYHHYELRLDLNRLEIVEMKVRDGGRLNRFGDQRSKMSLFCVDANLKRRRGEKENKKKKQNDVRKSKLEIKRKSKLKSGEER